jgi:hypothetical protein
VYITRMHFSFIFVPSQKEGNEYERKKKRLFDSSNSHEGTREARRNNNRKRILNYEYKSQKK